MLEWVAISISRGYFWPRDQTQVSCIESRFFTDWATREALTYSKGPTYEEVLFCEFICKSNFVPKSNKVS